MNHNDAACRMNEDAVALALHVLEPDEENAVRTHLPHCRSCRETARSTELLVGGFSAAVPQLDPPARLRSSILAQLDSTPQETPVQAAALRRKSVQATRRDLTSGPRGRDDGHGGDRPAQPEVKPRSSVRSVRRRLIAVAVVAVLGFAGIAAYTALVQQQHDQQLAQTQALADLIAQSGQPGTARATLAATNGQALAAVLVTSTGPTVITTGLPANHREASTYVLWGIDTAGPHPLGTFDVADHVATHPISAPTGGFSRYAISLEPGRSMPSTPTSVVASGAVVV